MPNRLEGNKHPLCTCGREKRGKVNISLNREEFRQNKLQAFLSRLYYFNEKKKKNISFCVQWKHQPRRIPICCQLAKTIVTRNIFAGTHVIYTIFRSLLHLNRFFFFFFFLLNYLNRL